MITKDHDTIHAVQRCIPVTKNTPCYTNICLFLQQTNPIYLPKYLQTLLNWVVLSRSIKLQLIVIKLKNCSLLKQHKCFSVKSKCLHNCKEGMIQKIKDFFYKASFYFIGQRKWKTWRLLLSRKLQVYKMLLLLSCARLCIFVVVTVCKHFISNRII